MLKFSEIRLLFDDFFFFVMVPCFLLSPFKSLFLWPKPEKSVLKKKGPWS